MSKVFTYVSVIVGVFAMLTIFGLTGSSTSQLLQALSFNSPSGTQGADFFSIFLSPAGILGAVGVLGGIVASLFRGGTWYWMVILIPAGTLAGWIVGDMYSVMWQSTQALAIFPWIGSGLKVLFVVWVAGFSIALISWVGGSD